MLRSVLQINGYCVKIDLHYKKSNLQINFNSTTAMRIFLCCAEVILKSNCATNYRYFWLHIKQFREWRVNYIYNDPFFFNLWSTLNNYLIQNVIFFYMCSLKDTILICVVCSVILSSCHFLWFIGRSFLIFSHKGNSLYIFFIFQRHIFTACPKEIE